MGFQMMEKNHSIKRSDSCGSTSGESTTDAKVLSSGYTPLSQEPNILPPDFTPRQLDIICARGRNSARHNEWYTDFLRKNSDKYLESNAHQKTAIIADILATCRSRGACFVKPINDTDRWEEIGDREARKKIAHGIRDQLKRRGKSIKCSLPTTMRQSESGDNSNTDAKKRRRGPRTKRNKKEKSEENNNNDSKKRPFSSPLKLRSSSPENAGPVWSIDSSMIPHRSNSNFFNPTEMSSWRLSNTNQSELTADRSASLSPTIARGSTLYGSTGIHAFAMGNYSANAPSFHEMLDNWVAMNADIPSTVRSIQERVPLPQQFVRQFPQHYAMITNSNNTLDSSNLACLSMMNGMHIGGRSTNNSLLNPNNVPMKASLIDIHTQQTQLPPQWSPRMSLVQMDAKNSFSHCDSILAEANVGIPLTANNVQSNNLLGNQSMLVASPTNWLPRDKDSFSTGEVDGDEGLALSCSPTLEPFDIEHNEGEHEKDICSDDDLSISFFFLRNDEDPEPL
jgi:hypothetical protein